MKFNSKSGKLGVLTVLAIVIYIALILSSFFSGIDYFMLGFEEGSKKATSMKEDKIQTKNLTTVYFLDLKAKPGFSTLLMKGKFTVFEGVREYSFSPQ